MAPKRAPGRTSKPPRRGAARDFHDNSTGAGGGAVGVLGKARGMDVLAEGVETVEQWSILQTEGCNELQGYLFGRPRPVQDIVGVITGYLPGKDGVVRGPLLVVDNAGVSQSAA